MPVIVRGLRAFEDLQRRLAAAGRGDIQRELAPRIGAAFVKQLADEFRLSRDPYGKPWAPVFRNRSRDQRARARRTAKGLPQRADKPLVDTGRLRASPVARVHGTEVRIALPVEYASYHQFGTRRITRRQILPESDTGGLGPYWTMAANKEAAEVLARHFGSR